MVARASRGRNRVSVLHSAPSLLVGVTISFHPYIPLCHSFSICLSCFSSTVLSVLVFFRELWCLVGQCFWPPCLPMSLIIVCVYVCLCVFVCLSFSLSLSLSLWLTIHTEYWKLIQPSLPKCPGGSIYRFVCVVITGLKNAGLQAFRTSGNDQVSCCGAWAVMKWEIDEFWAAVVTLELLKNDQQMWSHMKFICWFLSF